MYFSLSLYIYISILDTIAIAIAIVSASALPPPFENCTMMESLVSNAATRDASCVEHSCVVNTCVFRVWCRWARGRPQRVPGGDGQCGRRGEAGWGR